jgi:hypothetical protein
VWLSATSPAQRSHSAYSLGSVSRVDWPDPSAYCVRASSSGPHAGIPTRWSSTDTSVSLRLAPRTEGRQVGNLRSDDHQAGGCGANWITGGTVPVGPGSPTPVIDDPATVRARVMPSVKNGHSSRVNPMKASRAALPITSHSANPLHRPSFNAAAAPARPDPHRPRLHAARPPTGCNGFLSGFKAARRAVRAADSARTPSLPLALPLRRGQRRSARAKIRNPKGR